MTSVVNVRSTWCVNCEADTTQVRPNAQSGEWRCYRCGMYVAGDLRALQSVYDALVAERKVVIDAYDATEDGDARKAELLRQFDELTTKVVAVEKQFDAVIDG